MKVFYDSDADLNLIKEKKNLYNWIWKSRPCPRSKLKRQWS